MNSLVSTMIVSNLRKLTDSIVEVELRSTGTDALPSWGPGAHIGLRLPNGLVREYSLVSDPLDCERWVVAVHREPDSRGGSAYVHEQLAVGDRLEVEGPRNHFVLEPADRYLLIAGGIGVTPISAMMRHLDRIGAEWSALYAGRDVASMAYVAELTALAGDRLHLHSDAVDGRPPLADLLGDLPDGTLVYCCGPEGLVGAVGNVLDDPDVLRVERFHAPEQTTSDREPFIVELARSGERVEVSSSETLLDALDRCGVRVSRSCTEGICGTCEVGVLKGAVDHRDFLLTPDERKRNDVMMACVSRAAGDSLVLDLPVITQSDVEAARLDQPDLEESGAR